MLEAFVDRWGYLAVALGSLFEGEGSAIVGGALAHRGLLSFWLVAVLVFGGSFMGAQAWFLLGRGFGRPLIDRRPGWKAGSARVARWVAGRHGTLFLLGYRFVPGVRVVTPLVLGAASWPVLRFVVINAIGSVIWALTLGALGWGLGVGLAGLLERAGRVEELLAAAAAIAALLWLVARRHAHRHHRPG